MQAQRGPSRTQHKPHLEPVEYGLHWVHEGLVCVRHVNFMLFVSLSFALGSQHERGFCWNIMGLWKSHSIFIFFTILDNLLYFILTSMIIFQSLTNLFRNYRWKCSAGNTYRSVCCVYSIEVEEIEVTTQGCTWFKRTLRQ